MLAQDSLRLAPPQTKFDRVICNQRCPVSFDFRQTGTVIKYTLDGSVPTRQSPTYTQVLAVRSPGIIKARVFGKDFIPSGIKTVMLIKPGKRIDSLYITEASSPYKANGWKTLCDSQLGNFDFKANWLGYKQEKILVKIVFKKATPVQAIEAGFLQAQSSWIFLPQRITVWDEKKKKVGELLLPDADNSSANAALIKKISVVKKTYRELLLEIEPLSRIPGWHEGKGNKSWVFVDEIFVK